MKILKKQLDILKKASVMLLVVENRFEIPVEYSKLLVDIAWDRKCNIMFWRGQRRAIWWTRKRMVENFLKMPEFKGYTHVLFLDTDCIPTREDWLESLILHDKDIVTGYYCDIDGKPCSYSKGEHRIGEGLEEVEWGSMGYSLIKREVLEKVEYPSPEPIEKLDADTEFFKKCKEEGYKIYQDFANRANHLLINTF